MYEAMLLLLLIWVGIPRSQFPTQQNALLKTLATETTFCTRLKSFVKVGFDVAWSCNLRSYLLPICPVNGRVSPHKSHTHTIDLPSW